MMPVSPVKSQKRKSLVSNLSSGPDVKTKRVSGFIVEDINVSTPIKKKKLSQSFDKETPKTKGSTPGKTVIKNGAVLNKSLSTPLSSKKSKKTNASVLGIALDTSKSKLSTPGNKVVKNGAALDKSIATPLSSKKRKTAITLGSADSPATASPKVQKSGSKAKRNVEKKNIKLKNIKTKKAALIDNTDTAVPFEISSKSIADCWKLLLQLREEQKKNSKKLLLKDKEFVFLQVTLMKVPQVEQRRRRYLKLAHPLYDSDSEVCLFVRDIIPTEFVISTPDERIEHSIAYYEQFLKDHKIEGVTAIMPRYQLNTEYNTFALQRKLVDKFDLFIAQSSLLNDGKFMKNVGVTFDRKHKLPLYVVFPKLNAPKPDLQFKKRLDDSMKTSWFRYENSVDNYVIRVGTVSNTVEQLTENVESVIKQLLKPDYIPGGVNNVASLLLKTAVSKSFPLYINLASRNSVTVPTVKSDKPDLEAVTDELSTMPGKKVTVMPNGEVFIMDDSDENFMDSSDEEDDKVVTPDKKKAGKNLKNNNNEVVMESRKPKKKAKDKKKQSENEESESSDSEAEAAEERYMSTWNKLAMEDGDDSSDVEKIAKPAKEKKKKNIKLKNKVTSKGIKPKIEKVKKKLKKNKI